MKIMENKKPLVSVCCITYNHEPYIRDAIEGFLLQKTAFPIEIIIHDDASTDKTAEIIKSYANKYPDLIFPIYQTENQYSKGIRRIAVIFTFPKVRGKYIALCEGDDYWTDPFKLQKQVDFMEENPDCSVCFHAAEQIYGDRDLKNNVKRPKRIPRNGKYSMRHAILGGGSFMPTASMVLRTKICHNFPAWVFRSPVGDIPLMLVLAEQGKIGYIKDVMSVYRVMTANSWSRGMVQWERQKEHNFAITRMWREFDAWTRKRYTLYVKIKIFKNRLLLYYALLLRIKRGLLRVDKTAELNH